MRITTLAFVTLVVILSRGVVAAEAATITVGGACTLIGAIDSANANANLGGCTRVGAGVDDVIELTADVTLTTINNTNFGASGLPSLTSIITINGNGHTIRRDPSFSCPGAAGQDFRIFHVASGGRLTLNDVTVANGCVDAFGAGIFGDAGNVTLNRSIVTGNNSQTALGGGVFAMISINMTDTIVSDNSGSGGAGVWIDGPATILRSTFSGNTATGSGGAIGALSSAINITDSTFVDNSAATGGAISSSSGDELTLVSTTLTGNSGTGSAVNSSNIDIVSIVSSTIALNPGTAIVHSSSRVQVLNSILTNSSNCNNPVTSAGHNLATDVSCGLFGTGDIQGVVAGLGPYTDHGTPGSGHFPLLATSLAINSGDDCPQFDQLGHARLGECDRGAIEAGVLTTQIVTAVKDSSLLADSVHTNEGVNPRLHLRSPGKRRVVVGFDLSSVDLVGVVRARLVLTIVANSNDWTGSNNLVDAHPLLTDFVEGNGAVVGVAAPNRGAGSGTTWKCPTDTQISNVVRNCATVWNGGLFDPPTAPGVVHASGLLGDVSWDVTTDVQAGQDLWLIKKRKEGALQPGGVRYYSREGSLNAFGDLSRAPRLILELQ